MAVEIIDVRKDLPNPSRRRRSVAMDTPEWQDAVAKIDSGLKPHEGLRIVVSPKTLAKLGRYAPRTLKIQLKRYVQERKPGLVVFYRGSQDDVPVIWVTDKKDK